MRKAHRYSDESGQMRPDHSVLALRCWAQAPDLRDSLLDFLHKMNAGESAEMNRLFSAWRMLHG